MDASALDPAVVCGLIAELGAEARSQSYERSWERDAATWRAVVDALERAERNQHHGTTQDRPPRWLAGLVHDRLETLATRWSFDSTFDPIRALERLGLVSLEADDSYVLAAVGGIGGRSNAGREAALRSDPELLDKVVWRMFEVEGGGEVSLANVDKFSADDAGWHTAFLALTADGTLPRDRVLSSALSALNRDFSAYRAGWYRRLYDALVPTVGEMAGHQDVFRTLLRSNVSATVGFAVSRLRTLSKYRTLDDQATLPALSPAVVAGSKTAAVAAIRLIDEIAGRQPGLRGEAVQVGAEALEHPHADVQKSAGAVLKKFGAEQLIREVADQLEPSVQADLIGGQQPQVDTSPVLPVGAPTMKSPVSAEDLIERVAALLEDARDPVEVEQVLAGLARLDQADRLRPLAKRATAVLRRGAREGVTPVWLRGQIARLVLAAAGEATPLQPDADHPTVAFLLRRLGEVEAILRGQRPTRVLLAAPDHPDGWVGAHTLVARLRHRQIEPDECDLIAALLRLHPDDRPSALQVAETEEGDLDPAVADIVRYALGGPSPAEGRELGGRPRLRDQAAWVAASRARNPTGRDEWLHVQGIRGAGRSDPLQAIVVLESNVHTLTERGREGRSTYWKWGIDVANAGSSADDLEPTALRGGRDGLVGSYDREDLVGCLALIWPHDAEHFLVDGIHAVLRAAAFTEVSHDAVRVLDALADHPGRLGTLATTCLAAGLTASKPDQRAAAVDAVLRLSTSKRLDAAQLAAGMTSLVGPTTPTRLAGTLRDVASDGSGSRALVVDALSATIPDFPNDTRGLHALLELLREELLRTGRSTPPGLAPWLRRFTGSSRSSKVARALLEDT